MAQRVCKVEGCGKQAQARGLCPMHYQRTRKYGSPELGALRPRVRACVSCARILPIRAYGLCLRCYGLALAGAGLLSEYRQKNIEKNLACEKKYREANREKLREWFRRERKEHPERVRARDRKRRQKEKGKPKTEKRLFYLAEYYPRYRRSEKGLENSKRSKNIRRTRKTGAGGEYAKAEWLALIDKTNGVCPMCKREVGKDKLTPDHIIPVKLGGSSNITNIQPLCRSCNSKKGAKIYSYYMCLPNNHKIEVEVIRGEVAPPGACPVCGGDVFRDVEREKETIIGAFRKKKG